MYLFLSTIQYQIDLDYQCALIVKAAAKRPAATTVVCKKVSKLAYDLSIIGLALKAPHAMMPK